ncbi:aspartate aminotransferase family protein [Prosthecochloris sp. N3]|uniref:Acetylornithine aminotransferase n=1 Tax=Prosthecochloris ethylica TaxID=2743976 RepID=A0ABR9XPS1_9CHLB|nr:aspartate aminotransferase family protein [Prosthecochloris ethylica]MBF0587165.1 aspartate aminotransferase family protein [Prosthecochloris ethylica]MBF0636033.1 aspartate aminotransferase family protein [Prosthecochloris ethylica]NUK48337.1 aspartate aminotransferase family protein [Prosthecochloris ethylica]
MSSTLNKETEQNLFFHNYARLPLAISHGSGVWLYDQDGNRYLDMIAGIGVNALGYGDERLIDAICEQSKNIIHASNLFLLEPQFRLASRLLDISGLSKVFFSNSGTEAVEAAIKLSRKWASTTGSPDKKEVLSLSNCFHGRTYGAMSLTAKAKYLEGFDPLLPGTGSIEFNNVADLDNKVSDNTAAVFVEFIQGEGGIHRVSEPFVERLKELQKKHDFLIVADEIQAGCGRTGRFFSYQHFDITPDLVCAAKPLGGGLPLGAVIGSARVEDVFSAGNHGTTFGGNPVACAAGHALIEALYSDRIMENVEATGAWMKSALEELAERHKQILEIRQYGLMIGITVHREAAYYVQEALKRNVLVNATSQDVIRMLPPLTLSTEEASQCIDCLDEIFSNEQ